MTAAFLWGFGFVATVWSTHSYSPTEAVVYRFFVATFFGFTILFFITGSKSFLNKIDLIKAFPAGFLLGFMQLTQTIGLQTITAGDAWTFAGAVFVAFDTIYLGHVAPSLTELFRFNTYQLTDFIRNVPPYFTKVYQSISCKCAT